MNDKIIAKVNSFFDTQFVKNSSEISIFKNPDGSYELFDKYLIAGDDENSRDGIYPDDKLLEYTILFTCDKYEDVLDRLADIIIRLEDGLDIWGSLFRVEHRPLLGSIETIYTRLFPQDNSVYAFKRAIKRKYPEEPNNVKLKLKVLF